MHGGAQAVGASERVFELLDRAPQLPEPGSMEPMGSPEGGDINLQDVTCAAALPLPIHCQLGGPNVWVCRCVTECRASVSDSPRTVRWEQRKAFLGWRARQGVSSCGG